MLKAYLRAKGWSPSDLKGLGHDLDGTLQEAEKHALGEVCEISQGFRNCVMIFNVRYEAKDFEYIFVVPELISLWSPLVMQEFLAGSEKLLKAVQDFIVEK